MQDAAALQSRLDSIAEFLERNLGANLHSLILYGSGARGEFLEQRSDINLLLVLQASTAQAHEVLRELRIKEPVMEPFVVELRGLQRATQVFGLKFLSIARHYRVLRGQDVLKDLKLSKDLHVLLAEQECRNLRMRLTHAYITSGAQWKRYERFLAGNTPRLFIVLSDIVRCQDAELPDALEARADILATTFGQSATSLSTLWRWRQGHERLRPQELPELHSGLVQLLSAALSWIEERWPKLPI
jgi:predicted nucleotidyltransferase